jgi:hypothetical protein
MSNGKFYTGSINLSELLDNAKKGHSSFLRAESGKIYVNVKMWVNDEPNKIGHHASIKLNPKKDAETENTYIGNFKLQEKKEPGQVTATEMNNVVQDFEDDLPF